MFDRLSRSWELVKASGAILMQDRELLAFPAISSVAALVLVMAFAAPLLATGAIDGLSQEGAKAASTGVYVVGFLFYFSLYFVIFFFNTALVGAVMMRMDGGDPTLGDGLRMAASKIQVILGYAFIAATVGIVLRAIEERVGFIGQIVVSLIGVGWTLATYLVVPVLAARDVGPVEAIRESAELFTRTWGESVIGQAGIGLAFGLIHFAVLVCGVILVAMAAAVHSVFLIAVTAVLAIGAVAITSLIHAALSGIYSAALYRYASDSQGTRGFDAQVLQNAFQPK